jgi:hypothetical protein
MSDEKKFRTLFSSRMHFRVAEPENLFKAQQVSIFPRCCSRRHHSMLSRATSAEKITVSSSFATFLALFLLKMFFSPSIHFFVPLRAESEDSRTI